MYTVYLNAEIYGITESRGKAYRTIKNYIETNYKNEKFFNELIENLNYSDINNIDLSDGGDCCAIYTDNIF